MGAASQPRTAEFIDRRDWPQAFVMLLFLIIFPIGIVALWQEPRAVIPLYAVLPFTAIFAAIVPFMIKQVMIASTRELHVNLSSGLIRLRTKGPLRSLEEHLPIRTVHRLIFESTDNDGHWYCAMLKMQGGKHITFVQGNHEATVRSECTRMLAILRAAKPDLKMDEQKR